MKSHPVSDHDEADEPAPGAGPDWVSAALCDDALWPPPAALNLGDGQTAQLRDSMARFTGPLHTHRERRARVERLLEALDREQLARLVAEATSHRLAEGDLDLVADVAAVVPVVVLAVALGVGQLSPGAASTEVEVGEAAVDPVLAAVEEVVGSIGRGDPASATTDAATERLLALFEGASSSDGEAIDPVAAVSVLYQARDATAHLIAIRAVDRHDDTDGDHPPVPAPATVRVATRPTSLGGRLIQAGETVELPLGASGLPYGAGPHRGPGEELAELIAASVLSTVEDAGYAIDRAAVVRDRHRRPIVVPLRRG